MEGWLRMLPGPGKQSCEFFPCFLYIALQRLAEETFRQLLTRR